MDRFRREIQLAASLQHPYIVPLLAAGQAGDLLYYSMPPVEGESLRLGDREKAIHSYRYVADIWRHADPELQPYVTEAREGLRRMTSEPPR